MAVEEGDGKVARVMATCACLYVREEAAKG